MEAALAPGDVACVLAEPAMTNIGIVHPGAGLPRGAARASRGETGTLLILDETHTICAGPGGYTREHRLSPDILTIGKPIAGGVPAAVYGLTDEVAERIVAHARLEESDTGGIGGTLAGNALSLAAMRATLGEVLTEERLRSHDSPGARDGRTGSQGVIGDFELALARHAVGLPRGVLVLRAATAEWLRSAAAWTRSSTATCIWRP